LKKKEDDDPVLVEAFLENAHSREILFYQQFSTYSKSLKIPKFYYGFEFSTKHTNGLIIMEDMTPTAVTIPMLPGMNDEQVISMIDELAELHVTSWKHPEWMETIKNLERSKKFMEFCKKTTDTLRKIKPEWFEDLLTKLEPIFDIAILDDIAYEGNRFGFPASVVHGDLWSSNILWRKNENGEATSEVQAVIDWQMIHAGNPCEDIARLLSLNTSGQYRRANTKKLLKQYTAKVTELMDGKPLFTFEQIEEAYKCAMPFMATYTGFGTPMYYNMASVVGEGKEKAAKQLELLSRARMFFEDTLAVVSAKNQ